MCLTKCGDGVNECPLHNNKEIQWFQIFTKCLHVIQKVSRTKFTRLFNQTSMKKTFIQQCKITIILIHRFMKTCTTDTNIL